MKVDLKEKETAGSFELEGGGKVHLRLLTGTDLKEMRKACVKKVVEYPLLEDPATGKKRHVRFEAEDFDAEKFASMGHDRNITGWDDLYDRNEKLIPVTPENKDLLMERVQQFSEAVKEGNKALREQEKAEAEAAEKNLSSGLNGKTNLA
jgi:hypothetical protein